MKFHEMEFPNDRQAMAVVELREVSLCSRDKGSSGDHVGLGFTYVGKDNITRIVFTQEDAEALSEAIKKVLYQGSIKTMCGGNMAKGQG